MPCNYCYLAAREEEKMKWALSSQKGGYVLITIARSDVSASEEAGIHKVCRSVYKFLFTTGVAFLRSFSSLDIVSRTVSSNIEQRIFVRFRNQLDNRNDASMMEFAVGYFACRSCLGLQHYKWHESKWHKKGGFGQGTWRLELNSNERSSTALNPQFFLVFGSFQRFRRAR